jgi:hypothetical protein
LRELFLPNDRRKAPSHDDYHAKLVFGCMFMRARPGVLRGAVTTAEQTKPIRHEHQASGSTV